jgi:hypothetical protein
LLPPMSHESLPSLTVSPGQHTSRLQVPSAMLHAAPSASRPFAGHVTAVPEHVSGASQ